MAWAMDVCMSLLHTGAVRDFNPSLPTYVTHSQVVRHCRLTQADTRPTDEILDILLDQEGLEIELTDRMEADTPLHKAVRYVNSLSQSDWPAGTPVVDILLVAGCDPRIRNKAKLKPVELVDPRNTEVRELLRKGELAMMMGGDVVEDDEGPTGSASDSD